ncbi:MAG: TonB family protein [Pseudomonadota bacterium]
MRVDIVAMPKMTLKELQNMEIRPTPTDEGPGAIKAEEKIPEIPSEGPTFLKEKKKEDFLSMLKDVSKKKLKGNDTTKNSKIKNEELEKLILAGNKLSQGSALTGNQATAAEGAFIQYLQGLPDWVRPHWRLPSYLLSLDLKCAIRIYLNPQGLLLKAIVYESSGNQEYDDLALEAVKSSTPFPAPNDEIKNKLLQGEVLLGFPL